MSASALQLVTTLAALPRRARDSNKGTFGRVLVVAGSRGMSGAAVLAGTAALRGGAGLVRLAVAHELLPVVAAAQPCYMTVPLPQDGEGRLAFSALDVLTEQAGASDVLAVGPGLGRSAELHNLLAQLLPQVSKPVVLDAKGSSDPDGHRLAYRWFHYAEAGFVPGQSLARVSLSGTNAPVTTVTVTEACRPAWQPSKAPCPRSSAHLVLEVTDSGVPALTSYRRVILNVDANRP